jgi:hypothetical protein
VWCFPGEPQTRINSAPSYTEGDFRLGDWVGVQRSAFNAGRLASDRSERLEKLPGWTWDSRVSEWDEGFLRLQDYASARSTARVPKSYRDGTGFRLGQWVAVQRREYAKNGLSSERAERLGALKGWEWDTRIADWERGFEALVTFVRREGHARVPTSHLEDSFKLGGWVAQQRSGYAHHTIDSTRVLRLEEQPGWAWSARDAHWDDHYQTLVRYAARTGHARVPRGTFEEGKPLGKWVERQRYWRLRETLSSHRVARLEMLPGWLWSSSQQRE